MKRFCLIALLAVTLTSLSGCIIVPEHRAHYHPYHPYYPYWVY
jgi:hypothetical protein